MSPKWVLLGLVLLFTIGWVADSAQDCPALVERALTHTERACAGMRSNQACYGYRTLEAQLQPGLSPFVFNSVGDITGVDTIHSLRLSALDPTRDEWGVSVMRVRADISDQYPNENVTLLAFGAVSIDSIRDDHYQPMQAFAIQTDEANSGCNNITENGLLIQTPEGIGRVTLWINNVRVRVGSTVLFQAQAGGDLTVSTFEGLAQVEAQGVTQEAPAGMRVRVLLNEAMQPVAPPTPPEAFDAAALVPLVDMVTAFADGTVRQIFVEAPALVSSDANPAQEGGTFRNPLPSTNNPPPPASSDQPPLTQPPSDDDDGNGNGNGGGNDDDNGDGNIEDGEGVQPGSWSRKWQWQLSRS